jgi:SAM-dependent methyltransferase
MSGPSLLFDRALHRKRLDRAAPRFAEAGFLKQRAAADLVERLEAIMRSFPLAVDLSERMLAGRPSRYPAPRLVLDEERLPFARESLDLVVSSLGLHWTNDLPGALLQIRRALKPDGLFLGAILGGSTLIELRTCLFEAEAEVAGGAGPRVSPFAEAIDAAALLQRAGFALPVVDSDKAVVRYSDPLKLLADLRAMGETSVLVDRPSRPLTREVLARALALYVERFADANGRVAATFEILTITGWAPHESQQKPLKPGSAKMRLADALGTVEHKG